MAMMIVNVRIYAVNLTIILSLACQNMKLHTNTIDANRSKIITMAMVHISLVEIPLFPSSELHPIKHCRPQIMPDGMGTAPTRQVENMITTIGTNHMIEIEAIMTSMTEGMDMIETKIVKGIVIEIGIEIEDEIGNEIETETEVIEMIIQALAKIIVRLIHSLPDLRLLFLLHQLSVIKTGFSLPFLNNQIVSM